MRARVFEKREVAKGTLLVLFDLLGEEVEFKPGQYFFVTLLDPPYDDERGARHHFCTQRGRRGPRSVPRLRLLLGRPSRVGRAMASQAVRFSFRSTSVSSARPPPAPVRRCRHKYSRLAVPVAASSM